jgi:flagellin-like protein
MRKMWNIKKKDGVSPVIATILMVAITVVLAAVLYVMVMGFGGSSPGATPTATMTYSPTSGSGDNSNYTFVVAGVTKNDVKWEDCTAVISIPDGDGTPTATATMPTTGNIGAGDTIVLHGLDDGDSTTFTLRYDPTGGAVYQLTFTPS